MKPIIIIGAGLAGYTVAREFRKLDKTGPMFIVTADDGGFYSKPILSNAFAQGKHAGQLVSQNAAQMAAQLGASIITGTRVDGINTTEKTVTTSGGTFDYEKLVIAVGAQPVQLDLNGDAAGEVMAINHVNDYAIFRKRIAQTEGAARVTILGAGLIGCEFADDLASAGHLVTLVDPNSLPLAALAAPALSQGLRRALSARGVMLQLGTTAIRVDRAANALEVTLGNGDRIASDVVLSAVGLRPDLRLAQAAQLRSARGIVVDALGNTSAPDVYALGDCAEYTVDGRTTILPYIAPLMTAARAIARTLTGQPTAIDLRSAPVIVKTPSFPLALVPPPAGTVGSWHDVWDGDRIVCRFIDSAGVVLGFGIAPQEAGLRQSLMAEIGNHHLQAVA